MNVLIVGGTGFLGLHLIEAFWNMDPKPKISVMDINGFQETITGPFSFDINQITLYKASFTTKSSLEPVLKQCRPEIVVHCASPVHGMGKNAYRAVNVEGTQTLVDACQEAEFVKIFVYTSSAGVVFNGQDLFGVNESFPFPKVHMDEYNATKEQGEQLVLKANQSKLKTVAIRPAGIFGPGDRQMVPNLLAVARSGRHRVQLGDNNNLFDVTYAGNVAYAHVLAAKRLLEGAKDVSGQAFFVTNDEPIFFWSFARAIWKHAGFEDKPKFAIPRAFALVLGFLAEWVCYFLGKHANFTAFRVKTACATRYYDISKAKRVLGYKPQWTLQEALDVTAKYF